MSCTVCSTFCDVVWQEQQQLQMIHVLKKTASIDLSKFLACAYGFGVLEQLVSWLKTAGKKMVLQKEEMPNIAPEAELANAILDLVLKLSVRTNADLQKLIASKLPKYVKKMFSSHRKAKEKKHARQLVGQNLQQSLPQSHRISPCPHPTSVPTSHILPPGHTTVRSKTIKVLLS